jgi:arabinofuranosyltransferase
VNFSKKFIHDKLTAPMSRTGKILTLFCLVAFALILIRTAWVGDDVYITLRTVDNFVNGHGLRWNIAERVQSFTHPLWMFLFMVVYAPTRDAYLTALTVSIITSLLTFWLVIRRDGFAWLGVAILLFSKAFVDFSASGLENPLTHLLLLLFFIYFIEKPSNPFRLGLLAALLALNRIDAVLFVVPALGYMLFQPSSVAPEKSGQRLAGMALGFLPIILWEIFSLIYYGFPFPNTAYAKLGAGIPQGELLAQGWVYFIDSLQRDPLTLTVILTGIILAFWRGETRERLLALGSLLYLIYVPFIGGDFMSGRFLTASLLVSALLLIRLARNWSKGQQAFAVGLVVMLGTFAAPPNYILDLNQPRFTERDMQTGINDERAYYYPISGLMNYRVGKGIPFSGEGWVEHGYALRESGKSVVDEKNVGFIGYFAGPDVHIVDLYALCDPLLARLPASSPDKWRIGHFEREVPNGYLPTLRTGINQIKDPDLAAYYDQLALITRGPLFSRARLVAIWRMNTGQFDHLLPAESQQ